MKEIKREDLIIGEIYTQYFDNYNYVFLMTNNNTHIAVTKSNIFQRKFMKYWNSNNFTKLMTEATPEEKHWFETCIKEDKFVSYEDAMKSFKPEFVLPEKWCIKTTNMDQEAKNWFLNKQKFLGFGLNYYGNCPFHDTENLNNFGGLSVRFKPNFPNVEITLEQFKKYVLNKKEEVMETPKNKIIKSTSKGGIRRIDSVECSEGGVYKIGDKITVFTKNSPHKGKVFTIRGFRWNNAKTNICAITELHTLNGIGLDKIELYIEPKKELSLLEQAKLKYPVGTRYRDLSKLLFTITSHNFIEKNNNLLWAEPCKGILYEDGEWAEIVEDFVLPQHWCIQITNENLEKLRNHRFNLTLGSIGGYITSRPVGLLNWGWFTHSNIGGYYTEITTEQFLKYCEDEEI